VPGLKPHPVVTAFNPYVGKEVLERDFYFHGAKEEKNVE
jgi:hypothetical protein